MLSEALQIARINRALAHRPEIVVSKANDPLNLGFHWYNIVHQDSRLGRRIRGSGADVSDHHSVLRAWGEFVERYSMHETQLSLKETMTSSGYASHSNRNLAIEAAVGELVERDVFLCSWLLRLPAVSYLPQRQRLHNSKCLSGLEEKGYKVRFGILGKCMGFWVGIVLVSTSENMAIATTAKKTCDEMTDQLIREATLTAITLSGLKDTPPPDTIPERARPIDHLRVHMRDDAGVFHKTWFVSSEVREFPAFRYDLVDLTQGNPYARETKLLVYRAVSMGCQNLWFGPTKRAAINLERLAAIAGRAVSYEELNHETHPLA